MSGFLLGGQGKLAHLKHVGTRKPAAHSAKKVWTGFGTGLENEVPRTNESNPASALSEAIPDGGRGWNRTTNLSIKSRMLCQLSYASGRARKAECQATFGRLGAQRQPHAQAKYNIIGTALPEPMRSNTSPTENVRVRELKCFAA
jgi:hypothetical protein